MSDIPLIGEDTVLRKSEVTKFMYGLVWCGGLYIVNIPVIVVLVVVKES